MTTKEKIEVMEAFERGEEIEIAEYGYNAWRVVKNPSWGWNDHEYRIKTKPQKTVVIEKWLVKTFDTRFRVIEASVEFIESHYSDTDKVKLIDTYEVEL